MTAVTVKRNFDIRWLFFKTITSYATAFSNCAAAGIPATSLFMLVDNGHGVVKCLFLRRADRVSMRLEHG